MQCHVSNRKFWCKITWRPSNGENIHKFNAYICLYFYFHTLLKEWIYQSLYNNQRLATIDILGILINNKIDHTILSTYLTFYNMPQENINHQPYWCKSDVIFELSSFVASNTKKDSRWMLCWKNHLIAMIYEKIVWHKILEKFVIKICITILILNIFYQRYMSFGNFLHTCK